MKKMVIFILLLQIGMAGVSQDWKRYPYTPEGSLVSFPSDEGRHTSQPVEWWYTSGHLTGLSTGKHYSYMLSYFFSPVLTFDGFRILNISDDDLGEFFTETRALNYNIMATDRLDIEAAIYPSGTETWQNKKDIDGNPLPFEYELSAVSASNGISLVYDALKPPLILADDGFLYQGAQDYTYYYSQTRNAVTGTVTFNGISENVTGISWIDRQYGTFNPSTGEEYEWFCIQLSNGMDFNINNIFTEDNEIPGILAYRLLSAYIDDATQYTTTEFQIERLGYSFMPDGLRCYSQKWRITSPVNNVDITATALHPYNEVEYPFRFYEGPLSVTGTVNGIDITGTGFAELLHSYETPEIFIPDTTRLRAASTLFTWKVNNPDSGNPLKYDLEYSTDNQQTFLPVAQAVADTFLYWDASSIPAENEFWLKVTGYSTDKTLSGTGIAKLNAGLSPVVNIEKHDMLNIYPNPSSGLVTVEGVNINRIEVIDITGKLIYSSPDSQTVQPIDLGNQHKGIYFVKVTTGRETTTTKIILR